MNAIEIIFVPAQLITIKITCIVIVAEDEL